MKDGFLLWWKRYHNHVYGFASLAGLVLAVVFYFAQPLPSNNLTENTIQNINHINDNELIDKSPRMPTPFKMNQDFNLRDKIININVNWHEKAGGTQRIDNINVKTLERLFREKFIDPDDKQNRAPTAQKILYFMQSHPNVLASGYAVSPLRKDYRITLDGLRVYPGYVTQELKISFFEFCKGADEIKTSDGLWCWWD